MTELPQTKEELIAYGETIGLSIDARFTVERMQSIIMAELKAIESKPTEADKASEKMVMLMIHKTEGDTGSIDVPVAVNGKTWLIKRGVEVKVPAFLVEILQNAIKQVYIQGDVSKEITMREVPAYPFSSRAA